MRIFLNKSIAKRRLCQLERPHEFPFPVVPLNGSCGSGSTPSLPKKLITVPSPHDQGLQM